MQRYIFQEQLGDGTFGTVFRAVNRTSGEQVAVKCMKQSYASWPECLELREFRSLLDVGHEHPNIVQLYEVVRETNSQLYFVFEFMPDGNLYEFIKRHIPNPALVSAGIPTPVLSEERIRSILQQVLRALAFLHKKGYVHRDMKPENILLRGNTCKLADFGLVREVTCQKTKTEYISTRWYRAPEVLLRSQEYGKPIDLFGFGCVAAELYSKQPLFPGQTEIDQLVKLTVVLGSPKDSSWTEFSQLSSSLGFDIPEPKVRVPLEAKVPTASETAIDFIKQLLQWNPNSRPTCDEALEHNYFSVTTKVTSSISPNQATKRTLTPLSPPSYYDNPFHAAKRQRRPGEYVSPRTIQDIFQSVPPVLQAQALYQENLLSPTFPFY